MSQDKTQQYFRLTDTTVLANCVQYLMTAHEQSDKPIVVRIDTQDEKRSLAQNRLYWKWCTQAADAWGNEKEGVHYDFKRRFLLKIYYRDDASFAAMCDSIKAVKEFDLQAYDNIAKEVTSLTSTTKATTEQMTEYLDDIYKFCYSQGLLLQVPDELKWVRE